MNLGKKKELAMRTLNVGEPRVIFMESRLDEIKEAITKQDIRDLVKSGAIAIRPIKGRKKVVKKNKRSVGNIRKKLKNRKRNYVILTRKLRGYVVGVKNNGLVTKEEVKEIRKKIRNKEFKSKANLKEYITHKDKFSAMGSKKIHKKTRRTKK